jgi:nucleoside-diphosphate-sugar epimerase
VEDIARRLRTGRAGTMGRFGEGWVEPLHWSDLVGAIFAALDAPPTRTAPAFNVAGGERLTWNEYLLRLADALGSPLRRDGSAAFLLALSSDLARAAAARAAKRPVVRAAPTLAEIAVYGRRARYPSDRLTHATGWRPQMTLDAIFEEIARNHAGSG